MLLIVLLAAAGCSKTNRAPCAEWFMVDLRHAATNMGVLNIYVFNALTGALETTVVADIETIASGNIGMELFPGEYNFVSWGTSANNFKHGGFSISGEMQDDLTLALENPASFGELYHTATGNVVIGYSNNAPVPLKFTRHTNLLKVKVGNMGHTTTRSETPLNVYVTGKNGLYAHDGTIHPEATKHTYLSSVATVNGNATTFDVRLLRLERDFHLENPVLLHVERGGQPLIEPQDIVRLLMKAGYNSQDDFDEAYTHTIELDIDPQAGVRITVNGFIILTPTPIL